LSSTIYRYFCTFAWLRPFETSPESKKISGIGNMWMQPKAGHPGAGMGLSPEPAIKKKD